MSSRPQREKKPIITLANNQGRNVAAAAARAAARPKTVRRAVRPTPKGKNIQPQPNRTGGLPMTKNTLIASLILLIKQVTGDVDLQNFLISVYDETSNDDYTKDLFGGKTAEEAKKKIAIHVDLFSNKLYRGSTPQMSFNLKGDDTINLAYLMYLDMLHDTTIPKKMSFEKFCKESIEVSIKVPAPTEQNKKATKMVKKIQKSPVYILFGKGLKAKETDYIKLVNAFIDESGGKAEIAVKNNLPSIYPKILQKEVTIRKDQVNPRILTPGHNMFLGIDQEDEKATVTLDIQRTKYQLPNGSEGKIMYPLVSVANLMDPGKNMLIESAKEDSKYFMLGLNNRDIRSRLTWNYKQPKFTINHDNGSTQLEAYYTDAAQILNNTNGNRKTKRGYAYRIKNKKDEYRFPSTISKGKAIDGSTGVKVSKFLGDFFQALTIISYIKQNNNPKYHYCLATGDAMLSNIFVFLCSRSGVSPNLWMATSTKQVSKVYGKMIDQIQVVKPAPTQVRNAPNYSIGNEVVSSGNNRTEGGGNTNNNQNIRNSPSVSRNSTTRNNGGNVPMGNANNTASIAGSSQGSVSINNNKNNMNSNSQRPPKRARNNKTQIVNQPPAKRVNVSRNNTVSVAGSNQKANTRNRLIKNLKNKGLSNNAINRFVKSYNNGTKGVNQILQEVKTNTKRQQNAKNAAALRELKRLRPELFK